MTDTKRATITEMLRNYREAQETLVRSTGGGDGNPWAMPKTWNQSFRELERVLQQMSADRPKQTRMLLARYVDPTVSRRKLIGRRNSRGEVMFANLPPHSEVRSYAQLPERGHANEWAVVLLSWPSWVRASLVEAALQEVCRRFRGEPYLPDEFLGEELAA